ncbi:LON peptidase N-terminal domain and RING finger protein 3 [Armadillidium nasatum]|uniref:LON peptidase N-terminal domain and RING finger protein 3 n=1 Tax=Armadillidium nasatum TaxID=96803 RepID=A0A5N5T5B1_9CRUS|nr:LON peptidase N-terminal domain and RING finger protein 3 [Armadillidium nasatum]
MRDGYNTSTIEYIEDKVVSDEDLPKLKLLHDVVNKRARLWLKTIESDMRQRILSHYGEMPSTENDYWLLSDGPMWVWWLLAILPLEPSVLIRIIKEQSLTARLSQVSQALKYIVTHQSKTKR